MNNLKFTNKQNESFETSEENIGAFCATHELDIKALKKVIAGKMLTHRGYKLANPIVQQAYAAIDNEELEQLKIDMKVLEKQHRDLLETVKQLEKTVRSLKDREADYLEAVPKSGFSFKNAANKTD